MRVSIDNCSTKTKTIEEETLTYLEAGVKRVFVQSILQVKPLYHVFGGAHNQLATNLAKVYIGLQME